MKKGFLLFALVIFFPKICLAAENVTINEIAWMGTTESANAEWLELYNPLGEEVDLAGWRLEAEDGSPKINLTGKINASGFYLLERTGDQTLPTITADQIYTGSLSNTGENLILYDQNNNIIDKIEAAESWPGGDNETKNTLERKTDGLWQTSAQVGGTPKAQNSLGPDESNEEPGEEASNQSSETTTSSFLNPLITTIIQDVKKGDLIINEIFPNPTENPEKNEFIEIKNISNKTINLKNFILKNANKYSYVIAEVGLAPQAIVVFYRSQTNLAIANTKEKITLYSNENKIIDEVSLKNSEMNNASWQKNLDKNADDDFCWQSPTPGQENICQSIVRPIINLTGPEAGEVFETLFFDASDSFDKFNREMKFVWEFGDGRMAFGSRARQIYITPGSYEVKLKIIIDELASSTEILKVKIKDGAKATSTSPLPNTSTSTESFVVKNLEYLPNIFISEFLADPKEDEAANEFIEIFSNETKPYDLSNFMLSDGGAKTKPFILPPNTIIKPGQYLAFFRSQTKIALNNDGDTIKLMAPNNQIIDQVIYNKSKTGQSQVLDENFIWQNSQTPTPGEMNVLNQNDDTKKDMAKPKVLGAQNSQENIKPKETKAISEKSFGRYFFSGASAVVAATIGFIYKFFKK